MSKTPHHRHKRRKAFGCIQRSALCTPRRGLFFAQARAVQTDPKITPAVVALTKFARGETARDSVSSTRQCG